MIDRLYIVVRGDLAPGAQLAQSCHALRQFCDEHPEIDGKWFKESNTLVALSVEDEQELLKLQTKLWRRGFKHSLFREPDFGDEATALAIEPSGKGACRGLGLALS